MPHRVRMISAVAAVGLQFAVLYAPRTPALVTGGLPVDKAIHFLVFLVPTVLLVWAGVPRRWVIGAMALHAGLSELVQHVLLPQRSGDAWDVVADLLGVALGAWLTRPGSRWFATVDEALALDSATGALHARSASRFPAPRDLRHNRSS